jgi:hypothetical protein
LPEDGGEALGDEVFDFDAVAGRADLDFAVEGVRYFDGSFHGKPGNQEDGKRARTK